MPVPVFPAFVADGELKIKDRARFVEYVKGLRDGDYQIAVRKRSKPRSKNENDYYHAVVVKILADELGYFPNEMHGVLKFTFLPRGVGTSDLSTVEMEEFLSNVRTWASAELGIFIPLPNEVCM